MGSLQGDPGIQPPWCVPCGLNSDEVRGRPGMKVDASVQSTAGPAGHRAKSSTPRLSCDFIETQRTDFVRVKWVRCAAPPASLLVERARTGERTGGVRCSKLWCGLRHGLIASSSARSTDVAFLSLAVQASFATVK